VTASNVLNTLAERLQSGAPLWVCGATRVSEFFVEPTCFALLALARILNRTALDDYVGNLLQYQRPDGLWSISDRQSPASVWATVVAINALQNLSPDSRAIRPALKALLHAGPQESFWLWRLKLRTVDIHVRFDPRKYGWGWSRARQVG
jgi:hypothetical protein